MGGEALSLSFLFFFPPVSRQYFMTVFPAFLLGPHAGSGLVDQRVQLVIALLGEAQWCISGVAQYWLGDLFVLDQTPVGSNILLGEKNISLDLLSIICGSL